MKYSTKPRKNAPVPNCTARTGRSSVDRGGISTPCRPWAAADAAYARERRGRPVILEGHSLFPDRDLAIAIALAVGLLARRDREDEREQLVFELGHRRRGCQQPPGVEV